MGGVHDHFRVDYFNLFIGLINLVFVMWIDKSIKIGIKETISIIFCWPIWWLVFLILKYG